MFLSVSIVLRFSKGSSFLQLVPADSFVPSSVRTSKLPLSRLPKMNPFRLIWHLDPVEQLIAILSYGMIDISLYLIF
ncbi:MAG: hypothetical protein LBU32_09825 [Clostridiales bacterium]|jgi:hypothetical protein|nr:hypothetical protein [Clostridiales bacterium]